MHRVNLPSLSLAQMEYISLMLCQFPCCFQSIRIDLIQFFRTLKCQIIESVFFLVDKLIVKFGRGPFAVSRFSFQHISNGVQRANLFTYAQHIYLHSAQHTKALKIYFLNSKSRLNGAFVVLLSKIQKSNTPRCEQVRLRCEGFELFAHSTPQHKTLLKIFSASHSKIWKNLHAIWILFRGNWFNCW